jgi:hypothetical protein
MVTWAGGGGRAERQAERAMRADVLRTILLFIIFRSRDRDYYIICQLSRVKCKL